MQVLTGVRAMDAAGETRTSLDSREIQFGISKRLGRPEKVDLSGVCALEGHCGPLVVLGVELQSLVLGCRHCH
jgi:hypothetical protein